MSLEDFQQNLFYLRSGFVFAALAVCHHYAQLCVSASILLSNLAAISSCTVQFHTDPMVVRGDDKLCTNQHPPYVPGGLSKNSILPPFWVGACLVHHKLPLRTADVLVCPRRATINATRVALMPQRRIWVVLRLSLHLWVWRTMVNNIIYKRKNTKTTFNILYILYCIY